MPRLVEIPGVGPVEFPDGMSDEQVTQAIQRDILKTATSANMQGRAERPIVKNTVAQLQGPTMGFADEIGGGVGALATTLPGKDYFDRLTQNYLGKRDYLRGASEQGMKDDPVRNTAGQVALSLPIGASIPQLFGKATLPWQLGSAAVTGATAGAVSGAGETTKSLAEDPMGFAKDVGKSAAFGAAFPLIAIPAAGAVGAVTKNVASRFNDSVAGRSAREKIAESFLRDAAPGVSAPLQRAEARLGVLGPEASVADTGGANIRAQLDILATLPGATKQGVEQLIHQRQAGRADRLIGAMEQRLNPGGERLATTVDDLIATRQKNAIPLYNNLYKTGVFVDDSLKSMISAANELGAGAAAKKIATAKQSEYGLTPDVKWAGMRELDYLKQGLDDIIAANTDISGKVNKVGAAVQGLKTNYVAALDDLTKGKYKAARDAFAGPSQLITAAESGRKALTLDDMAIASTMRGMSESEKEAFRTGAAEALRQQMGRESGQTQILKMWKEPATREKLQALFGDERTFRQFASSVAAEARLKALESTGRGSQTAQRQYAAGDLDVPAIKQFGAAAVDAKTGNLPGLFSNVSSAWNRVKTPEPVRDAMGGLLLQRGPEARQGLLSIQEIADEVARNRTRQAGALGLLGGLF